ncbi:unnamed protein product [Allacma fusca]|uniref:RING-type domain-containing protein n=1 Tax=Allacma fusca TaxID=39272 RepID=A0A8J2LVF0_9HEXA|nr:unnamed protein product [Allacma fusca]
MTSKVNCNICFAFASDKKDDSFVNTPCGHIFHHDCIRCWISKVSENPVCPICRANITLESLVKLYGVSPVKRQMSNLKFVLIGDSGTGKTSLLQQYARGVFLPDNSSTIGCDLFFKKEEVGGKIITLSIWDTSGQEKYDAITPNYLRKTDGIFCVYDVTNPRSLDNLHKWLKLAHEYAPTEVPMILVGNKIDLSEERQIDKHIGQTVANGLEINFLETSAKEAHNVEAAFRTLAAAALENMHNSGKVDLTECDSLELTQETCRSHQQQSRCSC